MLSLDAQNFVSDQTQAAFQVLAASGADLPGLLALVSSAYADGGNYVLDQLHGKITAEVE